MKHQYFYGLLIGLLLIGKPFSLLAQQIKFNRVDPPSVTFSGFVGGIAQDKSGFIWITSRNGLFRYDGYNYKRYAPKTVTDFRLETVYIDREGVFWIATWLEGLYRLDPVTETWTYYQHDPNDSLSLPDNRVRSILEDSEGTFWIGTHSGLAKYDRGTGNFHTFKHDPNDENSISDNRVRKIYEDSQGTLWIGTGSVWTGEGGETDEGGLNRFDKKTGKFIRYLHDPANPKSLINNKVQAIFEDSRGVFWVGSAGDGLHTMNRATGKFERHHYDPAHPEKLSRPKLSASNNGGSDHITFIAEDETKQIWIGTLNNGLARYDPASKTTKQYSANEDFNAWSFLNSSDGILWIGDFKGTLYRVDPSRKDIPYSFLGAQVFSFEEDLSQELWIGTDKGIFVKNRKTGAIRQFVHDSQNPNSLSGDSATKILCDPSGTMWVGTNNGLNRFNPETNSFTRYLHDPEDNSSLSESDFIREIADGGGDSLWLGTSNGLDLMMKTTGKFTHFRHLAEDSNSIGGNFIEILMPEKSGNLWVGTWDFGGLNYLERNNNKVTRFLPANFITSLLVDSEGSFWVGTDAGLYKRKNALDDFAKAFDIDMPGATSGVSSMVEDDRKNIWVSTRTGILQINLQTDKVKLYADDYGVKVAQIPYQGESYKSESGDIYIGDSQGYYTIAPDEISTNPTPPDIAITDFKIDGQSVLMGKDGPLASPLENLTSLSLRYNQNTFTFNFVGIHFAGPEHNRLLFMLENYDQEWRVAGADKTAYYSNLSPGQYTFKVKAASSEGVWAERSISITITPPWWKTWWAYTIYGLCLITGIFLVDRFQRQRIIQQERRRTIEKEAAQKREIEKAYSELGVAHENLKATQSQLIQSEKLASLGELTAGIAHEIQNPLNFVNNFSELSVDLAEELKLEIGKLEIPAQDKGYVGEILGDLASNQEKINHHGKRAAAIVTGMLQHARTSSGKKEPTDLNALADEYLRLAYHGLRAKDPTFNATMKTDFDETVGSVPVIPQDIGRVILNLITNAFYAVIEKKKEAGGDYEPTVTVSTKRVASVDSLLGAGDKLEVSVKDNGNGIPKEVIDKIFQPFFTTKPTGQGTGLGLSLAYDIVKAHGGELRVETKEGKGADFNIILPIA